MADSLSLLDMALQLGERELGALAAGDVDAAESSSRERAELVEMAWSRRDPAALDDLRDKLQRLQCLQGRLTEEARRLHDNIRTQLQHSRRESQRLCGYRQATRSMPRMLTLGRGQV